jgi:hypothetical protein
MALRGKHALVTGGFARDRPGHRPQAGRGRRPGRHSLPRQRGGRPRHPRAGPQARIGRGRRPRPRLPRAGSQAPVRAGPRGVRHPRQRGGQGDRVRRLPRRGRHVVRRRPGRIRQDPDGAGHPRGDPGRGRLGGGPHADHVLSGRRRHAQRASRPRTAVGPAGGGARARAGGRPTPACRGGASRRRSGPGCERSRHAGQPADLAGHRARSPVQPGAQETVAPDPDPELPPGAPSPPIGPDFVPGMPMPGTAPPATVSPFSPRQQ